MPNLHFIFSITSKRYIFGWEPYDVKCHLLRHSCRFWRSIYLLLAVCKLLSYQFIGSNQLFCFQNQQLNLRSSVFDGWIRSNKLVQFCIRVLVYRIFPDDDQYFFNSTFCVYVLYCSNVPFSLHSQTSLIIKIGFLKCQFTQTCQVEKFQ